MVRRRARAPALCALALLCVAALGESTAAAAAFTTPLPPPPPPALPPPPPAELRLLARKCCAAWEHLAYNASAGDHVHDAKCAPREGGVVRHVTRELLAAAAASGGDALHWLPGALRPAAALEHEAEAWIVEYAAAGGLPCEHADRLVLRSHQTERYYLEPNGTLILYSPTSARDTQPRLFTPEQYCVDSADEYTGVHGIEHVFHMCPCVAPYTCVHKCCPAGMVMRVESNLRCVASTSGGTWSPFGPLAANESTDSFPNVTYEILNGRPPKCATGTEVKDPEMYPSHVVDAWLAYPHGWIFQENGPCADQLPGGGAVSVAACARPVVFEGYASASGWAQAAAAALLAVALATHLALGEATTALGSAVAAHAFALALRSALLAARLAPDYATHCTLLSLLIYFFMVSSAFWMNVIAINMVSSFRRAEPSACGATAWTQQAVAWGGAGAMAGATAAAWLLPALPAWLPRPLLRATRLCYHDALLYSSKWGSLLYFIAPIGVLLIVNIGLITYITICHRTPDLEKTHLLNKDIYINRPSRRAVRYAQQLALLAAAELAAEAAVVAAAAWAGGSGAREAQRWGEAAADCADVLRAVAVFAFCACSERARAAVRRALDATAYALGRCTAAECCAGKVSPSEGAEHNGSPGDEWRYVIGGAPAPVAGSEERRRGQQRHRRSRPLPEIPVIELWAMGGPPAQVSPDTPPTNGALPVFQASQPTSSL